jgi:predicted NBD/HSP70 family sugar kinase
MHRAAPVKLSVDSDGQRPDTEAIFRAAANGDVSASCVIDRALEYLAASIVNFMHIFDPEIFILGGNIAAAGPKLIAPIREKIAQQTKIAGPGSADRISEDGGFGGVAEQRGWYYQQRLLAI